MPHSPSSDATQAAEGSATPSTLAPLPPYGGNELPSTRVPREQVRRRLLDAAARVFAERGYERSRLEDIARAAGFTKGAVYSNFSSKHELFAELLAAHAQSTSAEILSDLPEDTAPEAVTERAAALLAGWLVQEAGWHQLELEFASNAGREPKVREVYARARQRQRTELAHILREHAGRLGVQLTVGYEEAAVILLSLHNGLGLEHGADPDEVTTPLIERALATVINGLIAPAEDRRNTRPKGAAEATSSPHPPGSRNLDPQGRKDDVCDT